MVRVALRKKKRCNGVLAGSLRRVGDEICVIFGLPVRVDLSTVLAEYQGLSRP